MLIDQYRNHPRYKTRLHKRKYIFDYFNTL